MPPSPQEAAVIALKKESSETTNIIKYLQICKSQIDIQCNLRITAAFLQVLQHHTTIYNLYSNLVQHPGCYIDSLLARSTSTWRYLFKACQDMSRYVLIHRAILRIIKLAFRPYAFWPAASQPVASPLREKNAGLPKGYWSFFATWTSFKDIQ